MNFLLKFIRPIFATIAAWVSRIRRPETIINDAHVADLKTKLVNGDVLVSATKYEFSNIFLPGFYSHAALYIDGYIYEAVTGGVRKSTLEYFCFKKDGVAILRLHGPDWTREQLDIMKEFCEDQVGEPYDFSFDWGSQEKWYCSKLVLFAFKIASPETTSAIDTMRVLGDTQVSPHNLVDSLLNIAKYGATK